MSLIPSSENFASIHRDMVERAKRQVLAMHRGFRDRASEVRAEITAGAAKQIRVDFERYRLLAAESRTVADSLIGDRVRDQIKCMARGTAGRVDRASDAEDYPRALYLQLEMAASLLRSNYNVTSAEFDTLVEFCLDESDLEVNHMTRGIQAAIRGQHLRPLGERDSGEEAA